MRGVAVDGAKGEALNVCPSGTKRRMLLWISALPYLYNTAA
jgi:hypothetical protein